MGLIHQHAARRMRSVRQGMPVAARWRVPRHGDSRARSLSSAWLQKWGRRAQERLVQEGRGCRVGAQEPLALA